MNSANAGPQTSTQVFGVGFGGPDHFPIDFGNFGGLKPSRSDEVSGDVSINLESANPNLSVAEIGFALNGGATISVRTDSNGRFDLNLPPGTFEGELDVIKTCSTASKDINALDARQVLRN